MCLSSFSSSFSSSSFSSSFLSFSSLNSSVRSRSPSPLLLLRIPYFIMKRGLEHSTEGPESKLPKLSEGNPSPSPYRKDQAVGIEEYVSSQSKGFFGVLKERYTDFQVNEIDLNGHVAHLTTLKYIETKPEAPAKEEQLKTLMGIVGQEQVKALEDLSEMAKGDKKTSASLHWKHEEEKEKRTLIHQIIKQVFPNLTSETVEEAGEKFFRISTKRNAQQQFARNQSYGDGQKYTKFLLLKENKDTMECVSSLTKLLRAPAKALGFAGTKDKRGVTTQWVTAHKVHPNRLAGINATANGWKMGNFQLTNDELQLGSLLGNRFTIVMRKITASDEEVNQAVISLKERGFINYYGMQRFGTSAEVMTPDVGCAILKNDWDEVTDLLLKPRSADRGIMGAARKMWAETKDIDRTLELMPKKFFLERSFLAGLKKSAGKNVLQAFCQIPRTMRMMYLHSVQSLVWNKAASRRIRAHGLKAVVGDLVYDPEMGKGAAPVALSKNKAKQKAKGKSKEELAAADDQEGGKSKISNSNVRVLTEETVGRFTIHDVVLPSPGMDVLFPAHQSLQDYQEILGELGLTMDSFKHKFVDISLYGAYRKIVGLPSDLKWEIMRHEDPLAQLCLTDFDLIQGKTLDPPVPGPHKALKIEFNLEAACYATMALRELNKTDTSSLFYHTLKNEAGEAGEGGEEEEEDGEGDEMLAAAGVMEEEEELAGGEGGEEPQSEGSLKEKE